MPLPSPFQLTLLGSPSIAAADGQTVSGKAVHRHRIALLALLAAGKGVSRDRVMGLLWPESDLSRARNLLKVSVYVVRQALGETSILSDGDDLRLNPEVVCADLAAFEDAVASRDFDVAVARYGGPFLDGFFLGDAPEFEQWVDRERARLVTAYTSALEMLGQAAEARGDSSAALTWWKTRAAHDPYDSRIALRVMRTLDASGNPAGALQHAAVHQRLLRDEYDLEPSAELVALAASIRGRLPAPPPQVMSDRAPLEIATISGLVVDTPFEIALPDVGAPRAGRIRDEKASEQSSRKRRLLYALPYGVVALAVSALVFGGFRLARPGASIPANEIADSVVRRLEPRLAASTPSKPRDRSPNIAADELYRMSNQPAFGRSDSGAQTSLGYLKRAIELDSTYAAAYAALTLRYLRVRSGEGAEASKRTRIELARRAAETAIRLDDSLAEGHLARAQVDMEDYDWRHAERELQRAIDVAPRDANPRLVLASLYSRLFRLCSGFPD